MSCPLPACLCVCLFSAGLSLCLTPCLSLHLTEFVHASLIRHHLFVSLPLCSDAVFSHMTFWMKPVALALSCSLYLQLHSSCIQMSIHMPHTQQTPPMACVDAQPSTNHHGTFILSSTSNHGRSLAAVLSSFFFPVFPPKVLWFHWRLCLTSLSVTLGRRFTASQTVIVIMAIWKQALAINLKVFRLCYCTSGAAIDHLTKLLYTIA